MIEDEFSDSGKKTKNGVFSRETGKRLFNTRTRQKFGKVKIPIGSFIYWIIFGVYKIAQIVFKYIIRPIYLVIKYIYENLIFPAGFWWFANMSISLKEKWYLGFILYAAIPLYLWGFGWAILKLYQYLP